MERKLNNYLVIIIETYDMTYKSKKYEKVKKFEDLQVNKSK